MTPCQDDTHSELSYVDFLPVGCVVADLELRIVKWNRLLSLWTGREPGGVVGKSLLEVVPRFNDGPLKSRLDSVIESGAPALFSSQLHDPIFPCEIHGFGVSQEVSVARVEAGEEEARILISIVDVTDLTHRLQRARAAQKKLRQHQRALERSNHELSSFAHVVSHDLKAPLRGIKNLSSWLTEDVSELLPEASLTHLEQIRMLTGRMGNLLDDILTYSKVGIVREGTDDVDVENSLQRVTSILSVPKGMEVAFSNKLPVIKTAREPFETVLRNLIGNALQHHDKETGFIEVLCEQEEKGICVRISDDGPGIEEQYHGKIFEIFQTLKPQVGEDGSGMGLAIVKKTVESRGGTITVESSMGSGTIFTVHWPCEVLSNDA